MQKHKKTFGALLLAGIMVFNVGVTAAAATEPEVKNAVTSENAASRRFTALWDCGRDLDLVNSLGKLSIYGCADTYPGYTSGVKVTLQKKNGSSWTDLISWEDAQGTTDSTVSEYYYVSRGTYRTFCVYTAYSTSGAVVETFEAYSDEVTY